MDIFVLRNLFQRKKKTLRDTVQIITEKKSERYHTRTFAFATRLASNYSGCGIYIAIIRTLYTSADEQSDLSVDDE